MPQIKTAFPLFQVKDPKSAAAFYVEFLDFKTIFSSDWYVQICHGQQEIAFITTGHESLPQERHGASQNTCLTLELAPEEVANVYQSLKSHMKIQTPLCDEPWGQRHFLGYDPSGIMLDVMAMLPQGT